MNIDERLERLTERHEALAQTVELLATQVTSISAAVASTDRSGSRIVQATDRDAENIRSLARNAEAHEH